MNLGEIGAVLRQQDWRVALLVGVAIGAIPLLLAYWPRLWAAAARLRGNGGLPAQLTPLVAADMSGQSPLEMLTAGVLALASETSADAGGGAERLLRGAISPVGSIEGGSELAGRLVHDESAAFDIGPALNGISDWTHEDGRANGWLWTTMPLRNALLAVAAIESAVAYVIEGVWGLNLNLFFGAVVTIWAAFHIDPRTVAGAELSGRLKSIRGRLKDAANECGSVECQPVREMFAGPRITVSPEAWTVAVGCRTARSESLMNRLRAMSHAAAGRPRLMLYTELAMADAGSLRGRIRGARRHDGPAGHAAGDRAPIVW